MSSASRDASSEAGSASNRRKPMDPTRLATAWTVEHAVAGNLPPIDTASVGRILGTILVRRLREGLPSQLQKSGGE